MSGRWRNGCWHGSRHSTVRRCWAIRAAAIFPKSGLERLAAYSVQTSRDLEDREIRETGVYALRDGSSAQ